MKENIGIIKEAINTKNAILSNSLESSKFSEKEEIWRLGQYDSPLNNFASTFFECIPDEYKKELKDKYQNKELSDISEKGVVFKHYIEETLSKLPKHDLYALELGGPGSRVFSEFKERFFKKTIGVCLKDIRNHYIKSNDFSRNHMVITGDILKVGSNDIYSRIDEEMKGKKIDLILSRMMRPLCNIKGSPIIMESIARKLYGMLNENGIIFFQVNFLFDHNTNTKMKYDTNLEDSTLVKKYKENMENMELWAEKIRRNFPMIDIQISNGVIRIHKGEGAPPELPRVATLS